MQNNKKKKRTKKTEILENPDAIITHFNPKEKIDVGNMNY